MFTILSLLALVNVLVAVAVMVVWRSIKQPPSVLSVIKYHNYIVGMGKTGLMKKLLNQFGEPELADDLIDHWTHPTHHEERHQLVQSLQQLSKEKRIRVTLIAGDVHCCGAGYFINKSQESLIKASNNQCETSGDLDERFMVQIVSSAIVNVPPPNAVLGTINKNAKTIHHLDLQTHEHMIPLFDKDFDGKEIKEKYLMGRRNYCNFWLEGADCLRFELKVENEPGVEGNMATFAVVVPPLSK